MMDKTNTRFTFNGYDKNGTLVMELKIYDRFMEMFPGAELETILHEFGEVINKRLRSDEENQFLKLLEANLCEAVDE